MLTRLDAPNHRPLRGITTTPAQQGETTSYPTSGGRDSTNWPAYAWDRDPLTQGTALQARDGLTQGTAQIARDGLTQGTALPARSYEGTNCRPQHAGTEIDSGTRPTPPTHPTLSGPPTQCAGAQQPTPGMDPQPSWRGHNIPLPTHNPSAKGQQESNDYPPGGHPPTKPRGRERQHSLAGTPRLTAPGGTAPPYTVRGGPTNHTRPPTHVGGDTNKPP